MMRLLTWLAAILVLIPIIYFFLNWSDNNFRSGAMGNWFGTVLGVVVGVPVGMALARAQQKLQAEAERQGQAAIRMDRLRSIRHRVHDELQHNSAVIDYLVEVLSKSATARSDLWGWATQVVGAVESEAYGELDSMLLPQERGNYGSVALAYRDLRRVVGRIRESAAAHDFLLGYSANETQANLRFSEAKAHANIVQSELTSALKDLKSQGQVIHQDDAPA